MLGPVSYTHLDVYKRQIQYCVANNINIPNGMAMDVVDKQSHLDKFSTNEPAKFNKLCNCLLYTSRCV